MANKSGSHVFKTLVARMRGKSRPFASAGGFRDGAARLLDVGARPARVEILGPGDPTRIAYRRVGEALRDALARAGERHS